MTFLGESKTFFEKVGKELERLFGQGGAEQAIRADITWVAPIVTGIVQDADPAILPLVTAVISTVQADLATASAVVQGATVSGDPTGKQTLIAALNSVKANLSALLGAADVKNTAKFNLIDAAVSTVLGEMTAALAAI